MSKQSPSLNVVSDSDDRLRSLIDAALDPLLSAKTLVDVAVNCDLSRNAGPLIFPLKTLLDLAVEKLDALESRIRQLEKGEA